MATEETTPEEGLEPIDAPVDGSEEAEVASPLPTDDYARTRGWTSKEEWVASGKAEDEWRNSQEFLDYGLDRSREMGKDLKELRSTVEAVRASTVEVAKTAAERAREEERTRLLREHDEAFDLGDKERAAKAVERLAETAAPAEPQADPLVMQFRSENAWFDSDPIARQVAIAAAEQNKHLPVSGQLDAAKKVVEERFPEYAPEKLATPAKAVQVAAPSGTATPPKRGKSFHDLPRENQEAARALKEAGLLPGGMDGYVKQFFNKEGTVA